MKMFNRIKKYTASLAMTGKAKKGFRVYAATVAACTLMAGLACTPAFAATNNPITMLSNLEDLFFGLVRGVGMIAAGWGVVQFAMSFNSHDPSQKVTGVMVAMSGILMILAKEVLTIITGG